MDSNKNTAKQSQNYNEDPDEILLGALNYIIQTPGGESEHKLVRAFKHWLNIPAEKLQTIAEVTKIIHVSSLLIDDIADKSEVRKGIPAAHMVYGLEATIHSAIYALVICSERLIALNHPEAIKIYTKQLGELLKGNVIEIYWRENFICPSEDEYRIMTIQKTGGLFVMAVNLMQLFSDCKKDFTPLLQVLGLYFQIRDDYCNLCLQEYKDNKGYAEDITEGKFSFPIRHALQSNQPESRQISNILRQRTNDEELKKHCINLMEKIGSLTYTRQVLADLDKKAREEIEKLGGNPYLISVLDDLLSWKKDSESKTKT